MNNVIPLFKSTTGHIDPNGVLDGAKDNVTDCIVIGNDVNGGLYVAASTGSAKELLWFIDMVKHKLLSGDFE